MRNIHFDVGEYYHVYNRGVDKRDVFSSPDESQRFYESLYLFNDKAYERKDGTFLDRIVLLAGSEVFSYERNQLVSIVAFKLMTNHFHLLLREEQENGISLFMHKLGTGYTNFFNRNHARTGSLFEGPFEAVHIESNAQLEHDVRYIHFNELDRHGFDWRSGNIENWNQALAVLGADPYSSHQVYSGHPQQLPVVDLQLAQELFPRAEEYREFMRTWAQSDLATISPDIIKLSLA